MLTTSEVGSIGERYAVAWLQQKGWRCYLNTKLPGATDIEASGGSVSLLVQVKTAIHPSIPAFPDAEDRKAIVARAQRNGREAWVAQLQINREGVLVGQITWTKLS